MGGQRHADAIDAAGFRAPACGRCGRREPGVDAERPILFIKRVRAAARVPIAIDYRYLPAELVADWDETSARGSPLHLLWQKMDLRNGDFAIEAAPPARKKSNICI